MVEHFNEPQISRILAGVSYMDKLLVDVEEILAASRSSAFPKYKNPLSPAQGRIIGDYISRLRQQIKNVLNDLGVPFPPPKFDSTHAARVTLQFIEVAIEELAPKRLTGYGEFPPSLHDLLAGGLQEMKGIVRQMDSYLMRPEADLSARIARLSSDGILPALLRTVTDVIDRHGLVEYRSALSQLLDKVEHPAYEIAFFGRVSAGKSSLLNRLIGSDLLPTGVTPVTSVPTRIRNRKESRLLVTTGDGRVQQYENDRLPDFVTEARNPANLKRVTKVIVEVPITAVPDEVVFVDTPGLGSLALAGAAETLAYLPRCDLGVVLVDASSNLHSDDVATVEALRTSSADAMIVLSKADLVSVGDLEQQLSYAREQIRDQTRMNVSVVAVSARVDQSNSLQEWIKAELEPRIADSRRLAAESNYKKALSLTERVRHALEVSLKVAGPGGGEAISAEETKAAEQQLREAARLIEAASQECYPITTGLRSAPARAIEAIAIAVGATWRVRGKDESSEGVMQRTINTIARSTAEEIVALVRKTAAALDKAVQVAAKAVEASTGQTTSSLQSLVKDLPPADFAGCAVVLTRPRMVPLSKTLGLWSIRKRIAHGCGSELAGFFDSYARALELWFRNTLLAMEQEFNTVAEMYRAQLNRLLASSEPGDDRQSLAADIEMLKKLLGR